MTKPICRRCLLKESADGDFYKNIIDYINSISPEHKADEKEYERRLNICKTCDRLINGMCSVCGCFVEVRAVKIKQHCAKTKNLW